MTNKTTIKYNIKVFNIILLRQLIISIQIFIINFIKFLQKNKYTLFHAQSHNAGIQSSSDVVQHLF